MSQRKPCPRLQTFLFSIVALLKKGEAESCSCINEQLGKGIASYLCKKYPEVFQQCGCHGAFTAEIDDYFRDWKGCTEAIVPDYYDCQEYDGLWQLLFLAINSME